MNSEGGKCFVQHGHSPNKMFQTDKKRKGRKQMEWRKSKENRFGELIESWESLLKEVGWEKNGWVIISMTMNQNWGKCKKVC